MPPPSSSRRRAAAALSMVLLLMALVAACGSTDETSTEANTVYRPTGRSATTRRSLSKEASDEFDKAIAAARASTSTVLGAGSSSTFQTTSTTRATSSTSSSSIPGGDPSTSVTTSTPSAKPVGVDECKLFVQLINFVGSLDPSIDPSDASATAARIADSVEKSRAGLDQLLAVAPASIRGEVDKVVTWLRVMAEGRDVDHTTARAALDNVRSWFSANCAPA